jgi:hypothetical protein
MTRPTLHEPHVLLTGPGKEVGVPSWIPEGFQPRIVSVQQLQRVSRLPEITVVRAKAPAAMLAEEGFLRLLGARHQQTPQPAKVLFVFENRRRRLDDRETLSEVLAYFGRAEDVEFARGTSQAAFAFDEALAKLTATSEPSGAKDPLGRLKSVIAATAGLRSASGRLSAKRIAACFGLSLAELASLIGRTRQTLWKTDDAVSAQGKLFPFERVARLRAVLPEADFRGWLNLPNEQLDGLAPIEAIRRGHVTGVADLAEDMLTGSPT